MHASAVTDAKLQMSLASGFSLAQIFKELQNTRTYQSTERMRGQELLFFKKKKEDIKAGTCEIYLPNSPNMCPDSYVYGKIKDNIYLGMVDQCRRQVRWGW